MIDRIKLTKVVLKLSQLCFLATYMYTCTTLNNNAYGVEYLSVCKKGVQSCGLLCFVYLKQVCCGILLYFSHGKGDGAMTLILKHRQ